MGYVERRSYGRMRKYDIEIPQVYRPASAIFLETIQRRCPGIEKEVSYYPGYIAQVADKPLTTKRYPPEILGRIIAQGIQEQIINKH